MKRVKAFWNSIWKNDRRLVALCYAVFLAGSILASLYGFAEDAYQRARGNVAQTEISGAQEDIFALTDLEQEGDLYTSTSVDPRMELDLAAVSPTGVPAYVRRVTVRVTFLNMDPGELSVFYKPRADMEEYDATYRVWAHKEAEDGVYTFTLPRGALYGLRPAFTAACNSGWRASSSMNRAAFSNGSCPRVPGCCAWPSYRC